MTKKEILELHNKLIIENEIYKNIVEENKSLTIEEMKTKYRKLLQGMII